jgi:hypothetical protein
MRRIFALMAICGTLLAFSFVAKADQPAQVDNPLFLNWSKYNVGSSETLDANINAGSMQMQFEAQYALAEKADDHVTVNISITMNMMGQTHTSSHQQTYAAKIDQGNAQQVGEENVTDGSGKSWDCKVWEVKGMEKEGDTVKVWSNDGIPGGVVKMNATTPRGDITYLMKTYAVK